MGRFLITLILAALASPAIAQRVPVPLASAEELLGQVPEGGKLETRVDGDLNGDGETDTAFTWRGPEAIDEERGLKVLVAYRDEFDFGHEPIGETMLDPFPQGPASLSIRKGVLIVEDLTGGTTATASTYRYRYDAKQKKMRLIGLDAQRYSRTNSHGTIKISWNLLDGAHILERGEPNTDENSDEAVVYGKPDRTSRKSLPVWMEKTPNPDDLIDSEIVPEGEDRD